MWEMNDDSSHGSIIGRTRRNDGHCKGGKTLVFLSTRVG